MCTAFSLKKGDMYFGRNMDIEYNFGEQVVIVPRNFKLAFKATDTIETHYAIMGMASVMDDYPLFAEGVNEKGLCVAGLNFPSYAHYKTEVKKDSLNLSPYEIITWLLCVCETVEQVKQKLSNLNIVAIQFKDGIPLPDLHWIVSDANTSIVIESTKNGIKIFENPIEVITNNPTFDFQLTNLRNYMHCGTHLPNNNFTKDIDLKPLGQGLGAMGIPEDTSPVSRFVRTAFTKSNSTSDDTEQSKVAQVFHILSSVEMVRGTVITQTNKEDMTTYSCCINASKGIYYYRTYENNRISAIKMSNVDIEQDKLSIYKLNTQQDINYVN